MSKHDDISAQDNTTSDVTAKETDSDRENEIDLLELASKLWAGRSMMLRWVIYGAIAGLVIAFSIPKEYTTTIKLAPEARSGANTAAGGLGALASMAGINMNSSSADAVSPRLYPDIVQSTPFALSLFDVDVTTAHGDSVTVRKYLTNEISYPWWSYIRSLPGMAIGAVGSIFRSTDTTAGAEHKPDLFNPTPGERGVIGALNGRITVESGTNGVIEISVTMQDPIVSALVCDTVAERLKEYVRDYRTTKARADLEYAQKLNEEAKRDYYAAQQRYASYVDSNKGVILQSVRTEQERLENEMQLAFNLYNSTAQQCQVAKAKVQETTPVYTIVQPATVPLAPSKPSKMLIIAGCVFLAFVASAAWILFGRDLTRSLKEAVRQGNKDTDASPHDDKADDR